MATFSHGERVLVLDGRELGTVATDEGDGEYMVTYDRTGESFLVHRSNLLSLEKGPIQERHDVTSPGLDYRIAEIRLAAFPYALWYVGSDQSIYSLTTEGGGPEPDFADMRELDRVIAISVLRHTADKLEASAPVRRPVESYTNPGPGRNAAETIRDRLAHP